MKVFLSGWAILLLVGFAEAHETDPFGPTDELGFVESADEIDLFAPVLISGPPRMIRVQVEFVEVAHRDYTAMMSGRRPQANATDLRKDLSDMVEERRAEVVETMMVTCLAGERSTAGSVLEFIYPTEYDPPGLPDSVPFKPSKEQLRQQAIYNLLQLPTAHTSFEVRNTGSAFEISPTVGVDGELIDLLLAPEMVTLSGYQVYHEFQTPAGVRHQDKWPVFSTHRVRAGLTCRDGQYVLIGVLTPTSEEGEADMNRKLLVLVKCDVLRVE